MTPSPSFVLMKHFQPSYAFLVVLLSQILDLILRLLCCLLCLKSKVHNQCLSVCPASDIRTAQPRITPTQILDNSLDPITLQGFCFESILHYNAFFGDFSILLHNTRTDLNPQPITCYSSLCVILNTWMGSNYHFDCLCANSPSKCPQTSSFPNVLSEMTCSVHLAKHLYLPLASGQRL